MMKTESRYSIRKIGDRHDYIRRYGVYDKTTGRRVDGVRGGLTQFDAQDTADDLNGVPWDERLGYREETGKDVRTGDSGA